LGLSSSAAYSASYISDGYPTADSFLGEKLQVNEADDAKALLKVISQKIRDQYYPGIAKRDEHTKSHGCVQANLTVNPNLPTQLKKGIFSDTNTYKSIIRFSNSSPDSTAKDIEKDGRGFSIKVLGVEGYKIVADPSHAGAQDFIMFSIPVFF
jgi:catalase